MTGALLLATWASVAIQAALFAIFVGLSAGFAAAVAGLTEAPTYYRRQLGLDAGDQGIGPPALAFASVVAGKHLANVAAGGLAVALAVTALPISWPGAVAVGIVGGGLILLTVGEIAPRAAASGDPEDGLDMTGWILASEAVLSPIARLIQHVAGLSGPEEAAPGRHLVDEREIKRLLETGGEQGVLGDDDQEMIEAVIDFGDEDVGDVMAPRTDIVAVGADAAIEEVADLVTETGYSRIPVYREDLDDVIGVVYAKDLLDAVREAPKQSVDHVLKETLFVPETAHLDEVLRSMKTRRTHVAIVHDEFGGTAGLVTLEDLLEEIVGDIFDEYDPEAQAVEWIDERQAILDARMDVERVNEEFDVDLPVHQGYETLGGFLFHELGRPGKEGETVEHDGLTFRLEEVANRRILKVRVTHVGIEEP